MSDRVHVGPSLWQIDSEIFILLSRCKRINKRTSALKMILLLWYGNISNASRKLGLKRYTLVKFLNGQTKGNKAFRVELCKGLSIHIEHLDLLNKLDVYHAFKNTPELKPYYFRISRFDEFRIPSEQKSLGKLY